ncbi:PdaC/SigV domain-containing protein [Alteriqipengyuania sp. 357]
MTGSFAKLLISSCIALAACTSPEELEREAGVEGDDAATAQPDGEAATGDQPAQAGAAREISEETDLYAFSFSYPSALGAVPALKDRLDEQANREEADLQRAAREASEEAREEGFPYNRYMVTIEWKLAGQTDEWFSLIENGATYFGGAHGNYGLSSVLWNRASQRLLEPIMLFESRAALRDALGDRYCDALDTQRMARRGGELDDGDDTFNRCPDLEELELVLLSNGQKFDRIMLYAAPYVAGPYVEGDYEVELSVDDAMRQAVKARYRDDFIP